MIVVKFGASESGRELFKWLYVGFNSGFQASSPQETNRMLEVIDKLDAISTPDTSQPWPFMDEARPLKAGRQELRLVESERKMLEDAVQAAMGKFLPTVSKKYLRPVREMLRDAPTEPATDDERGGRKKK